MGEFTKGIIEENSKTSEVVFAHVHNTRGQVKHMFMHYLFGIKVVYFIALR